MKFIHEVAKEAVLIQAEHNIPASLIIAQALLESAGGESELARNANNLFGIKGEYGGESYTKTTKEYSEEKGWYEVEAKFKKYPTLAAGFSDLVKKYTKGLSWEDHNRYADVLGAYPYTEATKAVWRAGYATDPSYPEKLNALIEKYHLNAFDDKAPEEINVEEIIKTEDTPAEVKETIGKVVDKEEKVKAEEIVKEAEPKKEEADNVPNIIERIIPSSSSLRPGFSMNAEYITIHNTANNSRGANAEMHARYLENGAGGRSVSWHYTVDDEQIIQHLPTTENGWHAGDGFYGAGNRKSIGIEICENSDGDFEKAVANAAWLVNWLMLVENISIDNVVPHKHWSGKNCPHLMLNRFDDFKKQVQDNGTSSTDREEQTKSHTVEAARRVSTSHEGMRIESKVKNLNFYSKPTWDKNYVVAQIDPGVGFPKITGKFKVDDAYQYEVENSAGETFYITAWKDYVDVIPQENPYAGKRVEAIAEKVNFYNSPRWNDPDGQFRKEQGWTIIDKIETDGSPQFKVKNSRGDIYYVTAREDLVKVI